jgi:hypothetical protein
MEKVADGIAEVREQLRDWIRQAAAKEARASLRRDRAAVCRLLGSEARR